MGMGGGGDNQKKKNSRLKYNKGIDEE